MHYITVPRVSTSWKTNEILFRPMIKCVICKQQLTSSKPGLFLFCKHIPLFPHTVQWCHSFLMTQYYVCFCIIRGVVELTDRGRLRWVLVRVWKPHLSLTSASPQLLFLDWLWFGTIMFKPCLCFCLFFWCQHSCWHHILWWGGVCGGGSCGFLVESSSLKGMMPASVLTYRSFFAKDTELQIAPAVGQKCELNWWSLTAAVSIISEWIWCEWMNSEW